MRNHRSSPLASGLGVLALAFGVAALPGCGKIKELIGMDKGADGGAAASQASGATVPSLDGFEGEIGLLIKPGAKEHLAKPVPPINLLVKSGKFRIDLPADVEQLKMLGKAYVVVAVADKKLFGVLDDKKEAVVIDLDKMYDQIKGMAPHGHETTPSAPSKPPPKIVKTGRKDTIAGYACEDWDIISEEGGKASVCIAERGASWFKLPTLGLPAEYAFMADMLDGRHFPLRMIGYEKDGTEGGRIEVTKLEQKPMAAAMFEVPAGYRTLELQQFIQEMMASQMAGRGMPGGAGMPAGMPPGMPAGMPPGMPAGMPPGMAGMMKPGAHPGMPVPKPTAAATPGTTPPKHK